MPITTPAPPSGAGGGQGAHGSSGAQQQGTSGSVAGQVRAVSGLGWVMCRMCTGVTSGKPPSGAGFSMSSRASSRSSACGTVR